MYSKFHATVSACLLLFMPFCTLQAKQVLDIKQWQTNNGSKVYFVEAAQVPIIDIDVAFAAGSARDGQHPGIAAMVNEMLNQGAADLDADDIAEQFDDIGAIYDTDISRDSAIVSLRSLTEKDKLDAALSVFTKVLSEPTFPGVAFNRERNSHLAALQQQQQSPDNIADNAFYKALYHNSPYAHPLLGTKEGLSQLTREQLQQFYHKYYVARNATIAIVGAIKLEQAKAIAEQISREIKPGQAAEPLPAPTLTEEAIHQTIEFPSNQTVIRLGQIGISRHAKDYFPLIVGNHILGGGVLVSRLFNEVREKRGLSYSVFSTFVPMATKGPFYIGLGTKNDQAQQALQIAKETLQHYVTQGPTEQELQAAKKNITGGFMLRFDSNQKIAASLLTLGVYNLPLNFYDTYIDKVNAVTTEQVKHAFADHIFPNKMVTISVGPQVKTIANG